MPTTENIQTGPGLTFDVSTAGPETGPLVLMLHGFGVSRFLWDAQVEALGNAGYRAVAPNQRGYAPQARPDPADHAKYRIDLLIADALAIVKALGNPPRFHLAGHDWGGSLSWHIADQYPDRLASLTMLSRPHPQAFNRALALPDGEQKRRSSHHTRFLDPQAGPDNLADNAKWLATAWPRTKSHRKRSKNTCRSSATRQRWRPPSPGTAPEASLTNKWPHQNANSLHLGGLRRHSRPRRRARHCRLHRRPLPVRRATRRRTLPRRPGSRHGQPTDAATPPANAPPATAPLTASPSE